MRREALKGVLDVNLWTAGYANMNTWKPQVDKVLDEVKDLFANGW